MDSSTISDREMMELECGSLRGWVVCLFVLLLMACGGWAAYHFFEAEYSVETKIWFPERYRLLNSINGTVLPAMDFAATLPTVTIPFAAFQKTFQEADVTVVIPDNSSKNYVEAYVHYLTTHGGRNYHAINTVSVMRSDRIRYLESGTLVSDVSEVAGARFLSIVWCALLIALWLGKDPLVKDSFLVKLIGKVFFYCYAPIYRRSRMKKPKE